MTFTKLLMLAALLCCSALTEAVAFDLTTDLFVKGDLHAAWEASPAGDPPKMFNGLPAADKKVDQRLSRSGKVKGGVTAFQYANDADAGAAYDKLLEGMGSETAVVDGLGDQARSYSAVTEFPPAAKMPSFHRAGIVFLRGKTVVYIGLSDMKPEELVPYAKKIDARLQK